MLIEKDKMARGQNQNGAGTGSGSCNLFSKSFLLDILFPTLSYNSEEIILFITFFP